MTPWPTLPRTRALAAICLGVGEIAAAASETSGPVPVREFTAAQIINNSLRALGVL